MGSKSIGERIKAARQRAGLSQAELAAKMERPHQSIGQWERETSSPKFNSLVEIAEALGISVEELICGEKAETSDSNLLSDSQAPLVTEQLSPDSLHDFIYGILQNVSDDLESHDIERYEIWKSTLLPILEKKISEEVPRMKEEVPRMKPVDMKKMNYPEELVPIDRAIANGVEHFLSLILPTSELTEAEMSQYFTSKSLHMLADQEGIDHALFMFGQYVYLRKNIKKYTNS